MRKRIISALLCIVMLVGLLPTTVFAAPAEDTTTVEHRIVHLDCGRKYFSVSWIKALIAESAAAGYNEVELAFGNDGLRFVLDNMDLTSINSAYTSDYVKNKIQNGNET